MRWGCVVGLYGGALDSRCSSRVLLAAAAVPVLWYVVVGLLIRNRPVERLDGIAELFGALVATGAKLEHLLEQESMRCSHVGVSGFATCDRHLRIISSPVSQRWTFGTADSLLWLVECHQTLVRGRLAQELRKTCGRYISLAAIFHLYAVDRQTRRMSLESHLGVEQCRHSGAASLQRGKEHRSRFKQQ